MTILTRLTISEELQVVSKRQLYIVLPEHQCVIKRQLNSWLFYVLKEVFSFIFCH